MSKVNELFEKELCVVNFGIESFYQDLKKQNVKSVHVAWKPVAGGDKKIAGYLKQLKDPNLAEKIAAANKEALRKLQGHGLPPDDVCRVRARGPRHGRAR